MMLFDCFLGWRRHNLGHRPGRRDVGSCRAVLDAEHASDRHHQVVPAGARRHGRSSQGENQVSRADK